MRVKFTVATALLILATVLLWHYTQNSLSRKPASQTPKPRSSVNPSATPANNAPINAAGDSESAASRSTFVAMRYDKNRDSNGQADGNPPQTVVLSGNG